MTNVVRFTYTACLLAPVRARLEHSRVEFLSADGRRRTVAVPLAAYSGHLHGVHVWTGPAVDPLPERDPAGAWYFNTTTDEIGGSNELLDLYGEPQDKRRTQRFTAEAFTRLTSDADAGKALALLVNAKPGDEYQATWTVRRDDGALRAAHFSVRAIPETTHDGTHHVVLRGITHDLGPAERVRAAPPPVVLEQRLLESTAEPGEHRALFNLRTLRVMRWIDAPLPGLSWEFDPGDDRPFIHPDDRLIAEQLSQQLATTRAEGTLRFRATLGRWISCRVVARLVALDQHTTAALLTFHES